MKGYCTLRELEEYYSIDDLADMIEAIEYENAFQELSMKDIASAKPKNMIMVDGRKL